MKMEEKRIIKKESSYKVIMLGETYQEIFIRLIFCLSLLSVELHSLDYKNGECISQNDDAFFGEPDREPTLPFSEIIYRNISNQEGLFADTEETMEIAARQYIELGGVTRATSMGDDWLVYTLAIIGYAILIYNRNKEGYLKVRRRI